MCFNMLAYIKCDFSRTWEIRHSEYREGSPNAGTAPLSGDP